MTVSSQSPAVCCSARPPYLPLSPPYLPEAGRRPRTSASTARCRLGYHSQYPRSTLAVPSQYPRSTVVPLTALSASEGRRAGTVAAYPPEGAPPRPYPNPVLPWMAGFAALLPLHWVAGYPPHCPCGRWRCMKRPWLGLGLG